MLVSVIIPAFKKQHSIRENIESVYKALTSTRYKFELIVVVDGFSADGTLTEASKVVYPNVVVVGYEHNRGKGYAVRYGMARAKGDVVAFIDAGMEIDPNGISMILEHMIWYNADIIVGSKRHPVSKVNFPFVRKIYSLGYNLGVRVLFGLKVRDTQTGLKVCKRGVLEKVLPRLVVKQFAFDVEFLVVANHLGFKRIYEAPVEIDLSKDYSGTSFKKFLFFEPYIRGVLIDTLGVFYRLNILGYYNDSSNRNWIYDRELDMRVNTGAVKRKFGSKYVADFETGVLKDIKFSVIIIVRSINDHLRENIDYIKRQKYKNYEVLIVTDAQDRYDFKDFRFRLLCSGVVGPGAKRNYAASRATGDYLVFLDDDAYPHEDWLAAAAGVLSNNDLYALGAPALTPANVGILEKGSGKVLESSLASAGAVCRYIPVASRYVDDYPTVNMFVKKKSFFEVGGFTEEFWPGEDTKLCLDLVARNGGPFVYDPSPVVFHHRRNLFRPHLKQISRYGMHRGQFAKIFPGNSRLLSYFIPSAFVVGLFAGPVLSMVFPVLWILYSYTLVVYAGLLVYEATKVVLSERNVFLGLLVGVGIFLTHVVYGTCFIIGSLKRPKLALKRINLATGNYIDG